VLNDYFDGPENDEKDAQKNIAKQMASVDQSRRYRAQKTFAEENRHARD
jgi:hypothetical protein